MKFLLKRVSFFSKKPLFVTKTFSFQENLHFKNGLILPTGQWYAPSAVNYSAYSTYFAYLTYSAYSAYPAYSA